LRPAISSTVTDASYSQQDPAGSANIDSANLILGTEFCARKQTGQRRDGVASIHGK